MSQTILARDLRIGDTIPGAFDGNGERQRVKALHEICSHRPGPHVHAITTVEHRCFPFTQVVVR